MHPLSSLSHGRWYRRLERWSPSPNSDHDEGGVAVSAHSFRTKCTLAWVAHAGSAGPHRRDYALNVVVRRRKRPWALKRNNLCHATCKASDRHSSILRKKGSVPDSAVGVLVGCAVPPSPCQLPVRKVPGWRALGFPLGLWFALKRFLEAKTETEEVDEGGTSPC